MKQKTITEVVLWVGVVVLSFLVYLSFMQSGKDELPSPVSHGMSNEAKPLPVLPSRAFDDSIWYLPLDYFDLPEFPSTAKEGEVILGSIPGLGLARVSLSNLRGLADLASELPDSQDASLNYWVNAPSPAVPLDGSEARSFGDQALAWLGVPASNKDWGRGVGVAILDTGVWTQHPAFEGAKITQIDLLEPEQSIPGEYDGHGTAVASLIAGNLPSQRGIAPAAELISVRVLDGEGRGDTFTLAQGIVAAVDRGAKVLSLSLGGGGDSLVLRRAVDYALEQGAVIVASAGNDGEGRVTYPAAYPDVIGVSAVDAERKLADFSNTGEGVDLAAPGIGLKSAWVGGQNVSFSGTSASAPLVAGAVAGILSQEPRLSSAEVYDLLAMHADDGYAAGKDLNVGHGVLNIERVLERNQHGVYDLAVGGFHFSPLTSATSNKSFEINVQNRGNEWISGATLDLDVEGKTKRFYLGSMKPGEVLTTDWFLTPDQILDEKGTLIKARVTPDGHLDSRSGNNSWTTRMMLPESF
jgi:hypothetical protein